VGMEVFILCVVICAFLHICHMPVVALDYFFVPQGFFGSIVFKDHMIFARSLFREYISCNKEKILERFRIPNCSLVEQLLGCSAKTRRSKEISPFSYLGRCPTFFEGIASTNSVPRCIL